MNLIINIYFFLFVCASIGSTERKDGFGMWHTVLCGARGVDYAGIWQGGGPVVCRCHYVPIAVWEIAI